MSEGSSGDDRAMAILTESAHRHDPARIARFEQALRASAALWAAAPQQLNASYREATWGDPGYQPRDTNLVASSPKIADVDMGRSQIVLMKPRVVLYNLVRETAPGFGPASMRATRGAWRQIHSGIYEGDETSPQLIALEVFRNHQHEERIEPTSKRIDGISVQMPEDGGLYVFRREGNQLLEKRVEQPKATVILRGIAQRRERAA